MYVSVVRLSQGQICGEMAGSDRGIDAVDGGMFVFFHRNDQAFFAVDHLRFDMGGLFRFDTKDHVVSFGESRNVFFGKSGKHAGVF